MSDLEICEKVRLTLAERGIRLSWFAEKTQIPYRRLQNQISGRTKITASEWERIKQVLGI